MNTGFLVMAASMGSRFGGLKQIAPIGPNGEIILDFSVYDAVKAGFNKVVIIIKKEIEKEFREACGKRIEKMVDVEYAFQELDKLPAGCQVPADRVKPWGTGHAVLCAQDKITVPFAVINADDFYGAGSYQMIYDWLVQDKRIAEENKTVRVLETAEKWYGVTYKEDTESVREAMKRILQQREN